MRWLKQSTSADVPIGPFLDTADGFTALTGLTLTQPDIRLKKNAGNWAQKNAAQTLSHEENGYYEVTLDATDTGTLGLLRLAVVESGALPVWEDFLVVPAMIYDSLVAGTDVMDASLTQILGTAVSSPATAGILDVNVKNIDNDAASASGTVTFPNATLASTTNITAGTITTATNVTTVNGLAAGVITAASIAADAITDAKVASDVTIASVTGAVGSVTGNVGGNVTGTVGGFTAGAKAELQQEAEDALVAHRLDELLNADSDIDGAAPPTVGSVFHELMTKTAGSFTYDQGTDSLEAVRDNMGTAQTGDAYAVVNSGTHGNAALKTLIDAVDDLVDTEVAAIKTVVDDILADTADMQPKLGTPVTDLAADIAAIEAQTDDIGVAGAGLTAVPWNTAWDAEVQSEVQDAIEANHLDHLLAATYDPASKPGAADALLNELVESDGGVSRYTANALEQAPTGGSAPTAADIADAVWEEAVADHSGTAGSTAEALAAAGSAGDPWTTALPGAYGAGTAGAIIGGNLNATVSSRATQTSVDTIDGIVDDILVDTAEIGTAGAGLTNINLPNQTMDIVGNITGNLSGSVGSVTGAVGSVTGNVGGNVAGSIGSLGAQAKLDVNAEVDTALADYDPPTRAELTTDTNSVLTAVGDVPTNAELATALGTADDATLAAIAALDAKVDVIDNFLDTEIAAIVNALTGASTEPTIIPDQTASAMAKLHSLFQLAVCKRTQTATTQVLYQTNGTQLGTGSVADSGTQFTRNRIS